MSNCTLQHWHLQGPCSSAAARPFSSVQLILDSQLSDKNSLSYSSAAFPDIMSAVLLARAAAALSGALSLLAEAGGVGQVEAGGIGADFLVVKGKNRQEDRHGGQQSRQEE
jgi:hypothetical protein